MSLVLLTIEILLTFALAAWLLYRYGDWGKHNVLVTLSVFVAWFFSFLVIFILPIDVSRTAYIQCLYDHGINYTVTTPAPRVSTTTPIPPPTSTLSPINISHPSTFGIQSPIANSSSTPSSIITSSPTSIPLSSTTSTSTIAPTTTPEPPPACLEPASIPPPNVLPTLWRIVYWTGQVLTWIMMPLMSSYTMAGDFSVMGKLKSSVVENAIYYLTFAIIFIVLLVYVAIHIGLDWAKLKVICISASNTWGLLLLVVLLGYGLVEIPRSLLNSGQQRRNLNYLYFKVAKLSAEKIEADERLEDVLEEIQHAYESIMSSAYSPFKKHIEIILEKCPEDWRAHLVAKFDRAQDSKYRGSSSSDMNYGEKSLARINANIKKATQNHHRTHCQWDLLIRKAIDAEDVARNADSPLTIFKSTLPVSSSENTFQRIYRDVFYTSTVEWYWRCVIKTTVLRALGYMAALFSAIIVWSEMTFSIYQPTLSILAWIRLSASNNYDYLLIEILCFISIAYLSICAYYTVFKIRVFNFYYLAPHHQTDEYSLLFCGMLLCRLTPPLCLNFLGLIHLDSHITMQANIMETSFTQIMGHLDVIKIVSSGLNVYLPICICLFCLATLFQFGTRLLHALGIEQFVPDDEMTAELIREGQDLVKREKNKMIRQYERSNRGGPGSTDSGLGTPYYGGRGSGSSSVGGMSSSNYTPRGQVTVPVTRGASPSRGRGLQRHSSDESARVELLQDAEPMDYASNWPASPPSGASSGGTQPHSRPPKGLFDDI